MTKASWLSGAAFVGALALAGCGQASNPVEPGAVSSGAAAQGAVSGTSAAPTGNGGPSEVNSGLAAIRQATARFHDVKKAIEAGYLNPEGLPCDSSPAGVMGVHSLNLALFANPAIDPLQPEALLYLPTGDGNFRLIGVEYLKPVIVDGRPWMGPEPPPASAVTETPEVLGYEFQGPMPGHVPGMPWHWDLHVWIWAPNPTGTFEQWNPRLSCPSGE